MGTSGWEFFPHSHSYRTSNDASLFSSSLPVLAHDKCEWPHHVFSCTSSTFIAFQVLSVHFLACLVIYIYSE